MMVKLEEGGNDIEYLKIGECGQRQDLQLSVAWAGLADTYLQ
jgi:hypothetical protein